MHRLLALRRVLAAAFVVLTSGVARAAEPVAILPYRIDYAGWFTVSATVKGQGPFDFIVDTGSMKTLIFLNTVDKIGGVVKTTSEPVKIVGLSATKKFQTYLVGDVSVGGQKLPALETVILSDWSVDGRTPQGILGLDFLERYHVEVDQTDRVIRLYAPQARYAPPSRKWRPAAMARRSFSIEGVGLFTTDVRVNNATIPFLIDLGATSTLINEIGASRGKGRGVQIVTNPWRGATRITDALQEDSASRQALFGRVRVGKTTFNGALLVVYNAPVFDELQVNNQAFGLVGVNLFAKRSFAFDFVNRTLFIGPEIKEPK